MRTYPASLDSNAFPLIHAKLSRPRASRNLVHRPRLYRWLDRALEAPLTLVCAPAGFGKSTVVSAWLDALPAMHPDGTELRCAWLSLDPLDNDPVVFVQNWIAALQTCFPGAGAATLELLQTSLNLQPGLLAVTLSNELADLPAHLVLVLDDFTAVRSADVQALFDALLVHWPQPLHLVITLRRDTPWRLVDLRAKGKVIELRTADLRFSREETRQFLAQRAQGPVSDQVLDQFDDSLEGWIAGMHLAMLSLRDPDSAAEDLTARLLKKPQMTAYLLEEILAQQPDPVQAFLLKTSIVERFSSALATALLGDDAEGCASRECIEWIDRHGLFITALDLQGEWRRYHAIFRDFLRQRLAAQSAPAEVSRLHERAAAWYAQHGHLDEALLHATDAGNLDLAASLVEQRLGDLLNQADPTRLQRWLRFIPDEFIARRPGLLMARAWVHAFAWQFGQQRLLLDHIEHLLDAGSDTGTDAGATSTSTSTSTSPSTSDSIVRGQLLVLRSQIAFFGGQYAAADQFCREALALLPPSWSGARGGAALFGAVGAWLQSGDDAVLARLLDEYRALPNKTDPYALRLLLAWCWIEHQSGRLERLLDAAHALLHQGLLGGSALMANWARYFLGIIAYARNDLNAAEESLRPIVQQRYAGYMASQHDSIAAMALVHQARGDTIEALEMLRLLSELDMDRLGYEDRRTHSLRARLQLQQGDLTAAGHWADSLTEPVPDSPLVSLEIPHMTRARILVERAKGSDIAAALALLDRLGEVAERSHNAHHRIDIDALRALALAHAGDAAASLAALQRAIEGAHAGGHVRPFLELGPRMRALLLRYPREESSAEAVRTLLGAFPATDGRSARALSADYRAMSKLGDEGMHGMVEPLSARELDVLRLVRKGLTDKEIAATMFISVATVKRHTVTIYAKLGVHRRADAVVVAESLGILSPG